MHPADEATPKHGSDAAAPAETEAKSPWRYSQEIGQSILQMPKISSVNWTASEFIDNEKNASWFMQLTGATAAAVVVIFLITRDLVTAFAIIIAAVLFAVVAKRRPRTLQYQLDHSSVNIDGKPYPYALFKSFAIMEEGAFSSIQLMPLKRFMPPISLYYPPENELQIVNTLGSFLPHEDRTHDAVDRLMRKIRF